MKGLTMSNTKARMLEQALAQTLAKLPETRQFLEAICKMGEQEFFETFSGTFDESVPVETIDDRSLFLARMMCREGRKYAQMMGMMLQQAELQGKSLVGENMHVTLTDTVNDFNLINIPKPH
jgi:hypothetical protein